MLDNGTRAATIFSTDSDNEEIIDNPTFVPDVIRQEQQRLLGQLTVGIAHDFNNLLTAIIGYSQLGLRVKDIPLPLFNLLNEIQTAGKKATNLSSQLLTFSKCENVEHKRIDVNAPIVETFHLMKRTFSKKIQISLNLAGNVPYIFASETQIQQIILNLCINSRDAMPNGGQIVIETELVMSENNGEYIRISVIDNGDGISPENQKYIFAEFFTTKENGTGLGLSNIYRIVETYKGFIEFRSVSRRTSFDIFIPTYKACEYVTD